MDMATVDLNLAVTTKTHATASEIPHLLDHFAQQNLTVLSLDCFDTLLWRMTAAPRDVFYDMQHRPLFQSLGVTAYQRMASAGRAYRAKFIETNSHQVSINDIYHHFHSLTENQKMALANEELLAEIEACYPFPPFIQLIQEAKKRGMKVIIVSDIYYNQEQLRKLLSSHLPKSVMDSIDDIFCSIEHGYSKSDGLFKYVLAKMEVAPQSILHVGDHVTADFESPRKLGIHAVHFLQFNERAVDMLRLQHSAASIAVLAQSTPTIIKQARYSPFRGILSMRNPLPNTPETLIGYMTFGPLLYAFARFIHDELTALKQSGKKIKPVFLLRDAYLLYKACEAYAGQPMGELARIRKFVAVAASFKTQQDIDYYMSSIQPYFYNFWVICEQLLLTPEETKQIVDTANASPNAQEKFNQLIHAEETTRLVFARSKQARENLKKHLLKTLDLQENDTLVLIDTGYHGVTQTFLTRALKDELNIEIIGRYFISSHDPDRPECRSLITSTWCEHGIFEQCCTFKEGAVSGYDDNGDPVFEPLKLSDAQYQKVEKVQAHAIQFIHDAKQFFTSTLTDISLPVLQKTAEAILNRQIFFPTPEEIDYFSDFQHDKDMGHDKKKKLYNIPQANNLMRQSHHAIHAHPYEQRAINLDLSLASLMRRAFDVEFKNEEKSYDTEVLSIISLEGNQYDKIDVAAVPTKDGYYTCTFNSLPSLYLGFAFGMNYRYVQIESISVQQQPGVNLFSMDQLISFNDMDAHQNILECKNKNAYLMLNPISRQNKIVTYQITFRPLIRSEDN